ncbi:5-formyltetrahydrofolate cyclo-ligase [uncultured Microbulbifer sp.]|uniref:5-formyltetrahydrofolate cyclo-ligase n=1 Tax=uncultured Microbulbifer sp. TaxID=348147 RepID=UPI0025D7471E|nr:5-formyltetrahydrofolate cyclo-ligase [uncultured Microbulbifer sp.]
MQDSRQNSQQGSQAPVTTSRFSKPQLRRRMRAARRALTIHQQRTASRRLCTRLALSAEVQNARHIGIYWPMDGEVDLRPLLQRFADKRFYLPVLPRNPRQQLSFHRWRGEALRYRNRYGIPEPLVGQPHNEPRAPHFLDLVLLPLVAFDPRGGRLGMGAGLYDRTFAFKHRLPGSGPKLIGVAHQLQCVDFLPVDSWDIPLAVVATDRRLYRCR